LADVIHDTRVHYLNIPKLFIAGDVWDPEIDEVIEGAKVSLLQDDTTLATTVTDGFGDFWFTGLEQDDYAVLVQAKGYQEQRREYINLNKSLNIGDFTLQRA
jgi:hypothetical protein